MSENDIAIWSYFSAKQSEIISQKAYVSEQRNLKMTSCDILSYYNQIKFPFEFSFNPLLKVLYKILKGFFRLLGVPIMGSFVFN